MNCLKLVGSAAIAVMLIGGGLAATVPAEARAEFATGTVHTASSVVADAVAFLGGDEAADEKKVAYDRAIAAGIPLADAGLSDSQIAEFQGLGSNVVVDCEGPAGHPEVAEINSLMAQAGGDQILCGGSNPALDTPISTTASDDKCSGAGSQLEAALVAAGGNGFGCGA